MRWRRFICKARNYEGPPVSNEVPKTLIGVTTYKKNDVLLRFLRSCLNLGEGGVCLGPELGHDWDVVIADDSPGDAWDTVKTNIVSGAYLTGNTNGIWANKNRVISYFLKKSDADFLLLMDNDVEFIKRGLLSYLADVGRREEQEHILGYIGEGLQISFPFQAESKDLRWHPGCIGQMMWFSRKLLQKIGYMKKFPYFYGGEHSDLSRRALRVQGYDPKHFPTLKKSLEYIKDSEINYQSYPGGELNLDRVFGENTKMHDQEFLKIWNGQPESLYVDHDFLDKELCIPLRDFASWTPEKIQDFFVHKPRRRPKVSRKERKNAKRK
jgi:glycosyltransferase involved in cell wall biosynthesis